MNAREVIDWLCKNIGSPCECDWKDGNAMDVIGEDWCHDHCTKVNDRDCWKEYFRKLRERRENG